MMPETRFVFKYRYVLPVLGIIALAYLLRVILIFERAVHDFQFYPAYLTDPDVYLGFARAHLEGGWPYRPYVNQPLISYWLALLMGIVGDSVPLIRLSVAAVDATMCGFMAMGGWLLTGRRWGGYGAALIFALYPVSMFYGTTLLIAPLATWLYILFFAVMLWQRPKMRVWKTLLLGIIIGLIVAARTNLAPIAAIWVLWLWFECKSPRTWFLHTLLAVIASLVVVAPFTLWNIHAGKVQLMAQNSPGAFYSGNNRDATGMGSRSPAMQLAETDVDWMAALQRDIALDPGRYIGLMLRKGAVFWSNDEPGNNLNFGTLQLDIPLLQVIPVGFVALAFFGLCGLAVLYYHERHTAFFFTGLFVWLTFAMMISFSISRLRYPVVAPLMVLAAYFVVQIPDLIKSPPRTLIKRYAVPGIFIAGILLFPVYAMWGDVPPLPPKRTHNALPADAIPVNVRFDERVQLTGWRMLPDWEASARGWMTPDDAYVVELFWEVLQPVEQDYSFFIGFFVDGERVAGFDRSIGGVSFPPKGTSRWQSGELYSEIIGFRPKADATVLQSGEVWVDVYLREQLENGDFGEIVDVPVTNPPDAEAVILQDFVLYPDDTLNALPKNLPGETFIFGVPEDEIITLAGYDLPETVMPGAETTFTFYWQAGSRIEQAYNLFIHVMDANDELAAQGDGQPHPTLITSTWREGDALTGEIPVTMPDTPGTYRVYIGLIEVQTGQRLSVEVQDYRPLIGEIIVEE